MPESQNRQDLRSLRALPRRSRAWPLSEQATFWAFVLVSVAAAPALALWGIDAALMLLLSGVVLSRARSALRNYRERDRGELIVDAVIGALIGVVCVAYALTL